MNAFLLLEATGLVLVASFALSEGKAMLLSREIIVYVNQNVTLSCHPRDSPPNAVFWYKIDQNNKDQPEVYLSDGPTFNITKATVDDTGIYSCSATEWGVWGIKTCIMINVIVPGTQSCAHGWNLYGNTCYMHSAGAVKKSWKEAEAYCRDSNAELVHVNNANNPLLLRNLSRNRNESTFWIASTQGTHGDFRHKLDRGRQKPSCSVFNSKTSGTMDCKRELPFICQRVLPRIPKDVSIEHITSSTARVGWTASVSSSNASPQVYHIELKTSSLGVVSRTSSYGRSVLFTHLRPNTLYQVRVQAENAAGNGSSSSFMKFRTKPRAPVILPSLPNAAVIAGQSITLQCGHLSGDIEWYKEGSDVPISRGQALTVRHASSKDEGTYHCGTKNGPRGSLKVLVIVPPIITQLKGTLLKQSGDSEKREIILQCETANSHSVKYAWIKDGEPLANKTDTVKVSLDDNKAHGVYECHVSNQAGKDSKTLSVAPVGITGEVGESGRGNNSKSAYLISAIVVLSVLLAFFCLAFVALIRIGKLRFKKKLTRKLTTQSSSTEMTPVELTPSEFGGSPRVVSHSPENVTQDHDDVFPYEVARAWNGPSGPYMSLRRGESSGDHEQDVTQRWRPDYFNISPSNRNDSAANCMYASLKYTHDNSDKNGRPYANMNSVGACNM